MNEASTGKKLRQLREERHLSQRTLARELKVSQQSISAYEQDAGKFSLTIARRVADYFEVSLDWLIPPHSLEGLDEKEARSA